MGWVQGVLPEYMATLDLDATIIEVTKRNALFCYKGCRAYQPLNVWCAEQELMVHSEFRDGNVPAGWNQLSVVKQAILMLPKSVRSVRLRSDTAGYEHALLKWLDASDNKGRIGRIEFAIFCDVTQEFKAAVMQVEESEWRPLFKEVNGRKAKTCREYAEVCFVPDAIAFAKNAPCYRYLSTREAFHEQPLPGMDCEHLSLPFQTMTKRGITYKVFGVVTNLSWDGSEVICFHDGRCGKSE